MNRPKSSIFADSFLLVLIVLGSVLPYVAKLGFYADDWGNLAILSRASGQGFIGQIQALMHSDPVMRVRPLQPIDLALSFKAFGMHALPDHLFSISQVGVITVLLYLVIRELHKGRWLAFLIALVFALIPHYSTDRFWFTLQIANISMAFALAGAYFSFRAIRPDSKGQGRWFVLAALFFSLSCVTYEVTLGLIIGSIAVVTTRIFANARETQSTFRGLRRLMILIAPFVLIGPWKILKQARFSAHHHFLSNLGLHWANAIDQALAFSFWTFGVKLPWLLVALYRHSALDWFAAACSAIIAVFVTVYLWRNMDPSSIPSPRVCLNLVLVGLLLFAAGFALFFSQPPEALEFTTTGLDNRITIAAAPGAACIWIAFAGLASCLFTAPYRRHGCFCIVLGIICLTNSLVVDGIAFYWSDGAAQQAKILRNVAADIPSLPRGSVLLLDGFCRYSGPGFVFETDGDTTGAVQLTLNDMSIASDVVSPDLHFDPSAVDTTYYGAAEQRYPYGDHLFIYNVRDRVLRTLPSADQAQSYLAMRPAGSGTCPAARDGNGEPIL